MRGYWPPSALLWANIGATECALRRLRNRPPIAQARGMDSSAAQKSSRAMRGPRRGVYAGGAGDSGGNAAGRTTAAGLIGGLAAEAVFFRGRRRFGIFCRRSQTRSVSSEIVTPTFASDRAINRIDAPLRRSASSTSRYGSNSANRRERGLRPAAINCASAAASLGELSRAGVGAAGQCVASAREAVGAAGSGAGGTPGADWAITGGSPGEDGPRMSCSPAAAGVSTGCIPSIYRWLAGRATGARRSGSKPKGLDVGVLTHVFFLFLVVRFGSLTLWLRLSRCILRWSVPSGFRHGARVQSLVLGRFAFVDRGQWGEAVCARILSGRFHVRGVRLV